MITVLAETASTNTEVATRFRGGDYLPEGHWLVADRQTAGKGRMGREWFDSAGNYMGSCAVHIVPSDPPPHTLALMAGLATHAVIAPFVTPPQSALLKWPNDVLIGPAKLAGILLERQGDSVIIGVGVNLATAPILPDRSTIALSHFGPAPNRNHFADCLARQFAEELHRWRSYGLGPTIARWTAAAHAIGTLMSVGEVTGQFAGLTENGALRLTQSNGAVQIINAGEVNIG